MRTMPLLLGLGLTCAVTPDLSAGQLLSERYYAEPLLYPELGALSYTGPEGSFVVSKLGLGVGGLLHDLDKDLWSGQARVAGSVWTGAGGYGFEVKAGPMWTPRLKWFGARVGLDPFWNQFESPVFVLPATFGVDLPVDLILGPRKAYVLAGVTPAWVANPARRVDWETADGLVPIGHEAEWRLGIGLTLGRFTVALTFSQRTTVLGTASGVGVGFGSAPYQPPPRDEKKEN